MTPGVKYLSNKHEGLSSNPSTPPKKSGLSYLTVLEARSPNSRPGIRGLVDASGCLQSLLPCGLALSLCMPSHCFVSAQVSLQLFSSSNRDSSHIALRAHHILN
jgi:hypothetical protein